MNQNDYFRAPVVCDNCREYRGQVYVVSFLAGDPEMIVTKRFCSVPCSVAYLQAQK